MDEGGREKEEINVEKETTFKAERRSQLWTKLTQMNLIRGKFGFISGPEFKNTLLVLWNLSSSVWSGS